MSHDVCPARRSIDYANWNTIRFDNMLLQSESPCPGKIGACKPFTPAIAIRHSPKCIRRIIRVEIPIRCLNAETPCKRISPRISEYGRMCIRLPIDEIRIAGNEISTLCNRQGKVCFLDQQSNRVLTQLGVNRSVKREWSNSS